MFGLRCPRCGRTIGHAAGDPGGVFACDQCHGRMTTLPVLRRLVDADVLNRLWREARYAPRGAGRACPSCTRAMQPVTARAGATSVPLDVCTRCELVWFDAKELEAMPRPALRSAEATAPPVPATRRRVLRTHTTDAGPGAFDGPDTTLGWILGMLGLPVEENAPVHRHVTWATWTLALATFLVSVAAFRSPALVERWAFLPLEPWRHDGLTFLTPFFLHGNWFHLLSNLYFLWTFGDDTEDVLGVPRYLGLLAAATVVGNLAHLATTAHPEIPCVGASGGISGVLAFYALAFPGVRIAFAIRWIWWVRLSARTAFLLWLGLQALLAVADAGGGVAYAAHLGGAATGLLAWFAWRPKAG